MKKSIMFLLMLCISILLRLSASEKQQRIIAADSWELLYYKSLPYKLMRPINFDSTYKYPVVICLHGASGMDTNTVNFSTTTYGKQLALPQVRLDYPAYIMVPKTSKLWDLSDLAKIKAVIAGLPSVDMRRIYVVGHSAGGQGTLLFIENEPQYFAAAIACSAYGVRVNNKQALINFNLWSMHGDADGTVPYDKDYPFFLDMKALNARMKFTTYFGGHHGKADEQMFGINGIDSTVTPLTASQFKTEFAGPDSDPEPNTLIWLFSKTNNTNTAILTPKTGNNVPFIFDRINSTISWSEESSITSVSIHDITGRLVKDYKIENSNQLNINSLNKGVFIVKCFQNSAIVASGKIVK
jgi:pimeloyl-ACP methyl ester carboxylesterase